MAPIEGIHTVDLFKRMSDLFATLYDYEEALVRQNQKKEDVDKIREIIEKSDSVIPKCLHDKQLLQFLSATDNIDECVKLLTRYYDFKNEAPEFCKNRIFESEEIKKCLETINYIFLPVTPDNCSIIYQSFASNKSSDFVYDVAIKTYFMMTECCLINQGPRDGIIALIDLKGTGLGHLTKASMRSIRLVFKLLQECAPLKIKAVHIINVVPFIGMIMALTKPFMKSDLFQKIQFHSPSMDYEKFYEECIPKSCLPSDYGGNLASVAELRDKSWNELNRCSEYFKWEERASNLEFGVYDWKESLDLNTQL